MGDHRDAPHQRPVADLLAAARLARITPLLGRDREYSDGADPLGRGWFCGAGECARVLAGVTGGKRKTGYAFGAPWPWVEVGEYMLGPGLPVAVTPGESSAPDGVYRRVGASVFREAGGRERVLLSNSDESLDQPFDLLWFADSARYTVRTGLLEVEDLFSRLVVPANRETIERELVQHGHQDMTILDALPLTTRQSAAKVIQVARGSAVTPPTWRDPAAFFRAGIGFDNVTAREDRLLVMGSDRQCVELSLASGADGWQATVTAGPFPFETLSVQREENDVVLSAVVAEAIDPLAQGIRERLAFDLRSFLVAL